MVEPSIMKLEQSGPLGSLEFRVIEDVHGIKQAGQTTCEADAFVLERLQGQVHNDAGVRLQQALQPVVFFDGSWWGKGHAVGS